MKFFSNLTPSQKKNAICLTLVAVMTIGLGIHGWYIHRTAAKSDYSMALPSSTTLESHVLIGGDVYWGRRMHDWSQQSTLKEAYPFSRLHELEREKYDTWIANLECPAVPGVKQPIGFVPQLWEFNCDTDYLPHFAKWVNVVSLANNHTANQGREVGLEATRQQLNQHGIQHFGHFDPHKTSEICSVISVNARARINGSQQEVKLPIAMCGFHGVYYTVTDKAMAEMERYAKYMPVIAMPHMGREYQAVADEQRRSLYQRMIDHGADAVIGNHSHWVQTAEEYKGKLIIYSMGNFIFDQQFSPEVMRSAAIDLTLSLPENTATQAEILSWTQLGNNCTAPNDACLAEAEKQQFVRLPLKLGFDIVGVDTSNQITHRANQRLQDDILQRLNWRVVQPKLAK